MSTHGRSGVLSSLALTLGDDGLFGRTIAAIVLVSAWVSTWRVQNDPDFGWHRAIGESVLTTGTVPRTDTFSWLTGGDPFVAHSWAWDVLQTLAYRVGGLMGTSLLAIPVSAAAIALTWYLLGQTAPTLRPFPRALLVAVGIVIGIPVWGPRSQIWDVVLVLACAAAWSAWLRHGRVVALALVPAIPILWVNLHGGSALAFVACLAALIVAIPVGNRWKTWPRRPLRPLVLSTVVALVALVVNPYGASILGLAANGDVGNAFLQNIVEWQPPRFDELEFTALRLALTAVMLVAFALRGRRRDPFLLLLAAGWTFMTLAAARFSIIAGPLIVIALAPAIVPSVRSWLGARLVTSDRPASTQAGDPRAGVVAATVAAGLIALLLGIGLLQIAPETQSRRIASAYPVAAVKAMLDRGCHGRILNAYDWGGYLIGAWTDRVATYGSSPKDLVGIEAALENVEIDPRSYLDVHRVDLILMPTGIPLTRWLAEVDGWSIAFQDDQATLTVRDGSQVCARVAGKDQILADQ